MSQFYHQAKKNMLILTTSFILFIKLKLVHTSFDYIISFSYKVMVNYKKIHAYICLLDRQLLFIYGSIKRKFINFAFTHNF